MDLDEIGLGVPAGPEHPGRSGFPHADQGDLGNRVRDAGRARRLPGRHPRQTPVSRGRPLPPRLPRLLHGSASRRPVWPASSGRRSVSVTGDGGDHRRKALGRRAVTTRAGDRGCPHPAVLPPRRQKCPRPSPRDCRALPKSSPVQGGAGMPQGEPKANRPQRPSLASDRTQAEGGGRGIQAAAAVELPAASPTGPGKESPSAHGEDREPLPPQAASRSRSRHRVRSAEARKPGSRHQAARAETRGARRRESPPGPSPLPLRVRCVEASLDPPRAGGPGDRQDRPLAAARKWAVSPGSARWKQVDPRPSLRRNEGTEGRIARPPPSRDRPAPAPGIVGHGAHPPWASIQSSMAWRTKTANTGGVLTARVALRLAGVIENPRVAGESTPGAGLAHDDRCQPGDADGPLGSGRSQRHPVEIDAPGEEVGGHVHRQGYRYRRVVGKLDAIRGPRCWSGGSRRAAGRPANPPHFGDDVGGQGIATP